MKAPKYNNYKYNSKLNFAGMPEETLTTHKRDNNTEQIILKDEFSYDHLLRLTQHTQSINGSSTKNLIANNEYDPLGQLITKKVGGTQNGSDRWQEVDYRYNIRGWLTDINDTGQLQKTGQPVDLFAFKINYNDDVPSYFPNNSGVKPLYNGNIAETYWRTASDNILRGYGYDYDELNRLENAYYQKPNSITPLPLTFDEYLSYDLNGNITGLQRYSGDDSPTGTFPADDLEYTYFTGSNQLKSVSDSTNSSIGFDDGNTTGDDYAYDANGSMTMDKNKGITSITYNHLNLPIEIQWSSTKKIEYLYNAAGVKVRKKVTNGTNIKTTDYLDGFQYNEQVLEFFPTTEGYVKATPTGLVPPGTPPSAYAFNYVFNYTDHLGNVRVSYTKDPQTGNLKILDESHYYPFGLKHQEYSTFGFVSNPIQGVIIAPVTNNPYKYKYNGKEFQDELGLGLYDYGWRQYDPAIGRWHVIDPLAEVSRRHSPYNYALNNPIYYIDPDGMMASPIVDTEGNLLGTDSEGWTGETIVMNKEDFTQGMDHSEALDKGTELSKHEEGIKITDKTWKTIEKNGGEKMTPYLSNQSDSEVYYKPESGDKNDCAIRVDAGKDVYAPVDGVATSKYSDSVLKIPTGSTITITSEGGGDIDFYGLGGLIRMHPEYGWIKKNIITDKYPNDTSWNELFFQASQIGEKKY